MNEVVRMILVLTAICLLSSFALTALNNGLADQIAKQKRENVQVPMAREILEGAPPDFAEKYIELEIEGVYWGLFPWIENGEVKAVTLETTGKGGYAGDVKVMTGIDLEEDAVLGVRVTESSETPGVGSRVADPSYLRTYRGLPITGTLFSLQPAGGDIEAVSGATRTSTAVADAVDKAVRFVLDHKDEIVERALAGPPA